tara:strand:+ start:1463 stop:2293 length:831 start_codon:yes stop_codon:yes gene_type:complete
VKKILLIGSSGYVGKKLKLKLSKKYILICPKRKKGFDVRKKKELKKYLNQEIDIVINLSGQQNTKYKEMIEVINIGNKNILELAEKMKKKITLIYISTSLVYGFSKINLKESSKKKPLNYYEKIKYKVEKNYKKTNQNFLILRLCNIYGGKKKFGIIELIIKSIKNKNNFYFDNINTFKNFIFINDVVNIIEVLIRKNIKNKVLNVGNQNISFINLSNFLRRLTNNCITFHNKDISLKKTLSQKIDNTLVKKIMKNYKFKTLQNYLKDEIRNKKIL